MLTQRKKMPKAKEKIYVATDLVINKLKRYHGVGYYACSQEEHFKRLKELSNKNVFKIFYKEDSILFMKRTDNHGG